jgi:hypothetical protein
MPDYGMMLLPFQDVQPMVLPFQGVHPTAPLFQGVQVTASVPIHHLRMLPTPSYVMASTTGSVFTMASAQPSMAMTTIAPTPTTGVVVLHGGPSLQHPFTDGIFYRGTGVPRTQDEGEKSQQIEHPTDIVTEPKGKMLTHQVLAAVRLQAATRGLLARRRVREMRDLQQIKPYTPSQLLQIALCLVEDFDSVRYVGDLRHTVSPTSGGACCFSRGRRTQSLRRRRLDALCSSLCGADQQPSGGEKAWCHWRERAA